MHIIHSPGSFPGIRKFISGCAVFLAAVLGAPMALAQAFPASIEASALDGSDGFTFDLGGNNGSMRVTAIGDINNDGRDDIAIGVKDADPGGRTNAGAVYVVFGAASSFATPFDLTTLTGSNGFVINGVAAGDGAGGSLGHAGDINGDGVDDLVIGANLADPAGRTSAGTSYVVFGRSTAFTAALELSALNGSNGFAINGEIAGDSSGSSVDGVGDLDNDGIDDVAIGAPAAENVGQVYVVYGKNTGFAATLELSALASNSGVVFRGPVSGDNTGVSVSGAGDVNGDGISDMIIGANGADPNSRAGAGVAYIMLGRDGGFPSGPVQMTYNSVPNGFIIHGASAGDGLGRSVHGAGDVNGDGQNDVIVGAPLAGGAVGPGAAYVVFGRDSGIVDTASLTGSDGFALNGVNGGDNTGISVAGLGDLNADGEDDVIIGAPLADPGGRGSAGASYIVFGKTSAFAAAIDLSSLGGADGFVINGSTAGNRSGGSVHGAGDINNDGFLDLIVGGDARYSSHVVYGRSLNVSPVAQDDQVATNENVVLTGNVFVNNGNGVDSDPEGDQLAVSKVNGAAANVGTQIRLSSFDALVRLNADGSFTYNPLGVFDRTDAGEQVSDSFTYTLSDGNNGFDTATVTVRVTGVAGAPVGRPIISGTPRAGETLSSSMSGVSDPDDIGSAFSYQWRRDGVNISGANSSSYLLVNADVGFPIDLVVTFDDKQNNSEMVISAATSLVTAANNPPTGAPSITGSATQTATLTAVTSSIADADGLGSFNYQWIRGAATNIAGATSSTYVLTQDDVGSTIKVQVSYTDGAGTNETLVSAATASVANVNDDPVGSVVVTGTAMVGETLSADASGISDADGLGAFSYRWRRGILFVPGETSSTYVLSHLDVGFTIRAVVSYTDGFGQNESVSSVATSTVVENQHFVLTVSKTGTGGGLVGSSPGSIDCGAVCSDDFDPGTVVLLQAFPAAGSTFIGWSGDCTGSGSCSVTMDQARNISAQFSTAVTNATTTLFSSVLPTARSGYIGGGPITVFASVINAGAVPATNCSIVASGASDVSMNYQLTDALNVPVGPPDQQFDLAAGETRSFILSMTATKTNASTDELFPDFICDNANVGMISGVNTVFLSIGTAPVPDILSIVATPDGNGIVTMPAGSISFLTASATNIGAGDAPGSSDVAVTVSVDTGNASLPVLAQLCETDALGACITTLGTGDVSTTIGSGPSFFAVFITDQSGSGIPLDPANSRVYLRFTDSGGTVRSVTSAALTAPAPTAPEAPVASNSLPEGRWAVTVRKNTNGWIEQQPAHLLVQSDGSAQLQLVGGGVLEMMLNPGVQGGFTGIDQAGVIAGQYIPDYSIALVGLREDHKLEIWGVRDIGEIPSLE